MVHSPDNATSGVGGRHGSPWRAAGATLVALSAVTGLFMIRAAVETDAVPPPPQPVAEAAPTFGPGAMVPSAPATGLPGPKAGKPAPVQVATGLPRSAPTRITIPKIKVDAKVRELGVNPDGTVQVPPLKQAQDAGWYGLGPSPGEIGNAVIVGHVDSRYTGPAVFYRLGTLRPGDVITLTRKDGSKVQFRVDGVRSFPKTKFPTELVYGPSDQAGLRVVTCGGTFDKRQQSYQDNIIVFATLMPTSSPTAPSPAASSPSSAAPAATATPPARTPGPAGRDQTGRQAKGLPPRASSPDLG